MIVTVLSHQFVFTIHDFDSVYLPVMDLILILYLSNGLNVEVVVCLNC